MRYETKKMGRQDARKKNGEMRRKTNKKLGDKMQDQKKWGDETQDKKKWGHETRGQKKWGDKMQDKKNREMRHKTKQIGRQDARQKNW